MIQDAETGCALAAKSGPYEINLDVGFGCWLDKSEQICSGKLHWIKYCAHGFFVCHFILRSHVRMLENAHAWHQRMQRERRRKTGPLMRLPMMMMMSDDVSPSPGRFHNVTTWWLQSLECVDELNVCWRPKRKVYHFVCAPNCRYLKRPPKKKLNGICVMALSTCDVLFSCRRVGE